jgi:hypothetical protein
MSDSNGLYSGGMDGFEAGDEAGHLGRWKHITRGKQASKATLEPVGSAERTSRNFELCMDYVRHTDLPMRKVMVNASGDHHNHASLPLTLL